MVNSRHSGKAWQERAQQTEKCNSHTNSAVSHQVYVHTLLVQHLYSVYYFFRFVSLKNVQLIRITLNGGPAGRADWRAVLPNEKHEFSTGLASCTEGRAGRLHIINMAVQSD